MQESSRAPETLGRVRQKQRTRWALLEATSRILSRGDVPTIESAAAEAGVSRATAYRYYSRLDALVSDASFTRNVPEAEDAFSSDEQSVLDRALAVERIVHELLLSDEIGMHVISREFMESWLTNAPEMRPPRPARRLRLLEAAIEPAASALGQSGATQLRDALAMVLGVEALISLRDVSGRSPEDARAISRWAIVALVEHACRGLDQRGR